MFHTKFIVFFDSLIKLKIYLFFKEKERCEETVTGINSIIHCALKGLGAVVNFVHSSQTNWTPHMHSTLHWCLASCILV